MFCLPFDQVFHNRHSDAYSFGFDGKRQDAFVELHFYRFNSISYFGDGTDCVFVQAMAVED